MVKLGVKKKPINNVRSSGNSTTKVPKSVPEEEYGATVRADVKGVQVAWGGGFRLEEPIVPGGGEALQKVVEVVHL